MNRSRASAVVAAAALYVGICSDWHAPALAANAAATGRTARSTSVSAQKRPKDRTRCAASSSGHA